MNPFDQYDEATGFFVLHYYIIVEKETKMQSSFSKSSSFMGCLYTITL